MSESAFRIASHNGLRQNTAPCLESIFTSGITPEEIIEEGLTWVSNSRGGRFETEMLGFFLCAPAPRCS